MTGPTEGTAAGSEPSVTGYAEEMHVGTQTVVAGGVRVRKDYDSETVRSVVDRDVEDYAGLDRAPAAERDSGRIEELEDGSVSIPIFEERLVVTKELVVRERVVLRKQTTTVSEEVTADLRRERVEVDADAGVEVSPAADAPPDGGTE
jgi:uncharacterized protein (TIGR02271 family)